MTSGAGQQVPARPDQHRPEPVQHRPRGRVRADLQGPLQAQRRDPVLLRGKHPARGEPDRQRRPPAVEKGPRCHRCTATAGRALIAAVGDHPPASVRAMRADEAIRPPQPVQVINAIGICPELGLELASRSRVVYACSRPKRIHGTQSLVRSDEYPRRRLRADHSAHENASARAPSFQIWAGRRPVGGRGVQLGMGEGRRRGRYLARARGYHRHPYERGRFSVLLARARLLLDEPGVGIGHGQPLTRHHRPLGCAERARA